MLSAAEARGVALAAQGVGRPRLAGWLELERVSVVRKGDLAGTLAKAIAARARR